MSTYAYDKDYLASKGMETVELKDAEGNSRVLVSPALQGRVMTSTTDADEGTSYGWINYKFIESGVASTSFNPFGGEERFWIGPEGGPNSWYFAPGKEQVFENWTVPAGIDTEPFEIVSHTGSEVAFRHAMHWTNASGHKFDIDVRRTVALVGRKDLSELLGVNLPAGAKVLGYKTVNTLTNSGNSAWDKTTGMPSVWLLGSFNPTPTTTVFIPYNKDFQGRTINDEYFGKVPADRLKVGDDGIIYFRIDGKCRSKIGLPKGSAKDICGSYDSAAHVLNILKYTLPEGDVDYVNGQWGHQDNPYGGDVINSYNDGPNDTGSIMGPFYEIETSSPGAALSRGESLTHTQYTIHIEASEEILAGIVAKVFGADLKKIAGMFK